MNQGSEAMGSGSAVFMRDQGSGCTIFWDQGLTLVTLLESRIRNFGYINGISDEKTRLAPSRTYTGRRAENLSEPFLSALRALT